MLQVIYTCITKGTVNKMKYYLQIQDYKRKPGACVPQRKIVEKFQHAQELLVNYHKDQGVLRSAFKVDMMNAFDSISQDLLLNLLKATGTPTQLLYSIDVCITSSKYSTNFNGALEGYFEGRKG